VKLEILVKSFVRTGDKISNSNFVPKEPAMSQDKATPKSSAGPQTESVSRINRRSFLGRIGAGAAATLGAAALADPKVASAKESAFDRVQDAFELRKTLAKLDADAGAATNLNNGDESLYPDKAGTYTKGLPMTASGEWI
jgi:hypothetical protein